MKRYIKAMSMPRKKAEKHVESYEKVIHDHIIECVVYGDSLYCFDHWINELSAWFDDINNTKLQINRKPPKFKEHKYSVLIFGLFGTNTSDAYGALLSYKANNEDYSDFEINRNLVKISTVL